VSAPGSLARAQAGGTWASVINVCDVLNWLKRFAVRVCGLSVWSYSKRHAVSEIAFIEFM
jgi:hypothetical protein